MEESGIDFLKRRAQAFLKSAQSDYDRGDYDLVLFHLEQAIQLYLKHLLCIRIGDYPKTHSIIRLIRDVIKVYDEGRLKEVYRKNLESLYLLEDSYIASRYFPRQYDREISERLPKFVKEFLEVLEWLENRS